VGTDLALVDGSGGDFGALGEALRRGCGGLCRDLLLSPCFFNTVLAVIGEDGVFCFITEKGVSDERREKEEKLRKEKNNRLCLCETVTVAVPCRRKTEEEKVMGEACPCV